MPRLEDDRDPAGQAVPPSERETREAAEAIMRCKNLLTQAQLAASGGSLDVDAWKEAGIPTVLRELRDRADRVLGHLNG